MNVNCCWLRFSQKTGPDGIFLSDINYLRVRLSVKEFLNVLSTAQQQFVALDGAQALGHRPINLAELYCDLYLAGTQKWFQATIHCESPLPAGLSQCDWSGTPSVSTLIVCARAINGGEWLSENYRRKERVFWRDANK